MDDNQQRRRIRVTGVVQGVGFRPFIYTLAIRHALSGWVLNDVAGVMIEVEGGSATLDAFTAAITSEQPLLARVVGVHSQAVPVQGSATFHIVESAHGGRPDTIVPADSHVCDDCLRETLDPADRRYRYPFTNCTHCGPRYSIIHGLPYDRDQTTMSAFTMCDDCRREYTDPLDRRYHAQPNACPICGPQLLLAEPGEPVMAAGDTALRASVQALKDGQIVAVKSVGGFHLAANARDGAAVATLRKRKRRDAKPFAIMVRDIDKTSGLAWVGPEETQLLTSPSRPIVLLRKRNGVLPESVAPRNPNLGVMLPSAPLHHLLLAEPDLDVLVMTSGNISGYPIAFRNEDALAQLFEVADLILYNDRDIAIRVDDSVVRCSPHPELAEPVVTFLRRSRGYAPYPLTVSHQLEPILAYGAELKTTVSLSHGDRIYVSQHVGDLKNDETFQSHLRTAAHLRALHDLHPRYAASDLHPAFRATRHAREEFPGATLTVQHHHAHMAACMADNDVSGEVLGVVFDGAGYGEDETIWGGEFLLGDYVRVRRLAHIRPLVLLGGDKAVHEPIRTAYAVALDTFGNAETAVAAFPALSALDEQQRHVFATMAERRINAPIASSMGRLFDAVAALLGVCAYAEYEAHGPIELEGLLRRDLTPAPAYPTVRVQAAGRPDVLDYRLAIRAVAADLAAGADLESISRRFHSTVVAMVVEQCQAVREEAGVTQVALSGGVFLNEFVQVNCLVELSRAGFATFVHGQVPTNDGGVSLGQVVVADARIKAGLLS